VNNPTVSVIIIIGDDDVLLREALTSLLDQNGPTIEVILVDTSTRGITRDLKGYLDDQRVRFMSINGTKARGFNKGVAAAAGDWIAIQSPEESATENRFQLQLDAIGDRADSISFGFPIIDQSHTSLSEDKQLSESHTLDLTSATAGSLFRRLFFEGECFWSSTAFMNKSVLQRVGSFNESFNQAYLFEYWVRALKAGVSFQFDLFKLVKRLNCSLPSIQEEKGRFEYINVYENFFDGGSQELLSSAFSNDDYLILPLSHENKEINNSLLYLSHKFSFVNYIGRIKTRRIYDIKGNIPSLLGRSIIEAIKL